jgi:hypothetical protein
MMNSFNAARRPSADCIAYPARLSLGAICGAETCSGALLVWRIADVGGVGGLDNGL